MSETILITGANGGIGLAVTKIMLAEGDIVFACYRDPGRAKELLALRGEFPNTLHAISLDVDSDESVAALLHQVCDRTESIDILVNMAGILPRPHFTRLENLDFNHCRIAFETNALGPLRMTRACLPLLRRSERPRVVNVSSPAGIIGDRRPNRDHFSVIETCVYALRRIRRKVGPLTLGGRQSTLQSVDRASAGELQIYAYGASKAALNRLTRSVAAEFRALGVVCVALDPGWVRTSMGGSEAPLSTAEAGAAICRTIRKLTLRHSGTFIRNDGRMQVW